MWNAIVSYFPSWEIWLQAAIGLCVPYGISLAVSKTKHPNQEGSEQEGGAEDNPDLIFAGDLHAESARIQNYFQHQSDFDLRMFCLGKSDQQAAIFFIKCISDKELIETHILKSLMTDLAQTEGGSEAPKPPYSKQFIVRHALTVSGVEEVDTLDKAVSEMQRGNTVLLIDQCPGRLFSRREKYMREVWRNRRRNYWYEVRVSASMRASSIILPCCGSMATTIIWFLTVCPSVGGSKGNC